jgi:hypothetical protein
VHVCSLWGYNDIKRAKEQKSKRAKEQRSKGAKEQKSNHSKPAAQRLQFTAVNLFIESAQGAETSLNLSNKFRWTVDSKHNFLGGDHRGVIQNTGMALVHKGLIIYILIVLIKTLFDIHLKHSSFCPLADFK